MKEKTENEMFSFSERVIKEVVKRDDEYTNRREKMKCANIVNI